MRQNIERGIAQLMQAKAVDEGVELIVDAQAAVLEVVIVEAKTRIDKTFRDATAHRLGSQVPEVTPDRGDHVVVEAEITDLAYGWALHVAQNNRRVVRCRQFKNVLAVQRPR